MAEQLEMAMEDVQELLRINPLAKEQLQNIVLKRHYASLLTDYEKMKNGGSNAESGEHTEADESGVGKKRVADKHA